MQEYQVGLIYCWWKIPKAPGRLIFRRVQIPRVTDRLIYWRKKIPEVPGRFFTGRGKCGSQVNLSTGGGNFSGVSRRLIYWQETSQEYWLTYLLVVGWKGRGVRGGRGFQKYQVDYYLPAVKIIPGICRELVTTFWHPVHYIGPFRSAFSRLSLDLAEWSPQGSGWGQDPGAILWSDYSKKAGGHFIRIRLKIAKKCGSYLNIFSCVKINGFFSLVFSLSGSRCMSDAITSTKLEQTGKIFWDSRCCLCAWVSAFWARRMKVKWGITLFMCWL